MKKYDYLLFDADNTLFDFSRAEQIAFEATADYGGLEYSEELFRRYSAINDSLWKKLERREITLDELKTERFRLLLISLGRADDGQTLSAAAELRDKYMDMLSRQTCLIDGADEVCHALKGRYKMYIVTNGIGFIQKRRLRESAIFDCFDGQIISEEIGTAKPSGAFFDKVTELVGDRDKSKYLVIGDSLTSDCDGAIRYGLDICRFNPDGKPSDGRDLTYDIKRLTDLFGILGETTMTDKLGAFCALVEKYNSGGGDLITLKKSEPLSLHSSFKIGGAADLFLVPSSETALAALAGMIKETGARAFFLGNGTNLLFSDEGFRGAVVSLCELRKIEINGERVSVGAGTPLVTLCKAARDASLSGLEKLYGIPGTVGGAVYMNAGAYGGVTADSLVSSTYLDLGDMSVHSITRDEHAFDYRDSVYKHTNRIILSAEFELSRGDADEITAQMNDIMGRRVSKQPLEYPSAGSVFKRPEGRFAGQMIEESGLKGYGIGGAEVSEKHAGFIINKGGARCADVLALIGHINDVMEKNYGQHLECEVIYVEP